jgi:hypothetical protein
MIFTNCPGDAVYIVISSPPDTEETGYGSWDWIPPGYRLLDFTKKCDINKQCIGMYRSKQHCYVSPAALWPGGIRTRIVCSPGGCDDHCATPPSRELLIIFCSQRCHGNNQGVILQFVAGWRFLKKFLQYVAGCQLVYFQTKNRNSIFWGS